MWKIAKRIRYRQTGGFCESCGAIVSLKNCVGHHIIYQRNGGSNTSDNCMIRCKLCEWKDPHGRSENHVNHKRGSKDKSSKRH